MDTHPVFRGLKMHADHELERLFGLRILERTTIHEWPLSCVQRLDFENGSTAVYKTQLPPTVEVDFYARASSSLIPGHRDLGRLGKCETMAIDWIDAPLLRNTVASTTDLVQHGHELVSQIGAIEGDLPTYLDIGSEEAWRAVSDEAMRKLRSLAASGRFRSVTADAVERVQRWTTSPSARDAVQCDPAVSHGDLKADQVFVEEEGYRVIDWQRPVVAPPNVDLVSLLVGEGIDPRGHVDDSSVRIFWFLRLCWAVEAQVDLFPDFQGDLFDRWSDQAVRRILNRC